MLVAENVITKKSTPVQAEDSGWLVFILRDTLKAGEKAEFDIRPRKGELFNTISFQHDEAGFWAMNGSQKVLRYNTAVQKPPPDSPAMYSRSGFIHPVYSPSGLLLTDDFPAGHAHQHGIMMAWTNTTWRGKQRDFWNQHLNKGNVAQAGNLITSEGVVMGKLQARLEHFVEDSLVVLNEKWDIDIYATQSFFVFDIVSVQTNTSSDTFFLNQYHYGGVSYRGSSEWNKTDLEHFKQPWSIATDSGFTLETGNGKHAAWVLAEGAVGNGFAGLGVVSYPSNFRYPQAIRIHPTMPYWCYSPVVDGAFFIAPGQSYRSAYRYVVFDSPAGQDAVKAMHDDLLEPPVVTIVR